MIQAITQEAIEATNGVILTVREADTLINNVRLIQTTPGMGSPNLKQPTFSWEMQITTTNYNHCKNYKKAKWSQ